MRRLLFAGLLLFLFALPALAAAPEVSLKDDKLFLVKSGKATELEAFAVANSNLRYVAAGEDDAKAAGLAAGLYLFAADGKAAGFIPSDAAEFCSEVALSPNGKVLAMDSGTYLIRDMHFFSYPGLTPLKGSPVEYFQLEDKPALLWLGEAEVLVTRMESESDRVCDYDPCGPTSVVRHNLSDGSATAVLEGTPLCDFTFVSLQGSTLTASKLCLQNLEAWKVYPENAARESVTVPLP